jgi:hypothetical protein
MMGAQFVGPQGAKSMADNGSRAKIIARIWQSIAQSGIQFSSIPKEQLDTLVGAIADGMLLALDDLRGNVGGTPQPQGGSSVGIPAARQETVLWKGRPFLSLVEHYQATSDRVILTKGLLSRDYEDLELIRLQDVDFEQNLGGRLINRGTIILRSADASSPLVKLRRVASPLKVHEIIRGAWLSVRQRYGLRFQEEMTISRER